ncbi:MAG TPA: response regulator transcription factor [Thermoanaerobaculia bacterium]|jgi:DNA-binding NarL/FixJ family response regulator|nr:response regulator transcription factor [Thermoanaerobaculia bacterium]
MPIRIVLADDHPLILDALVNLLRAEDGFEVAAICANGAEALDAVRRHRPDVLILDLRMPGLDGLAVLRAIAGESLPTRTILLTAEIQESEILEAMRLGVRGVVLKEMASGSVVQCVRKVHAGELWLEKRSAANLIEKMARREEGASESMALLTSREKEIVILIGRGLRNKEIAARLSIGEQTVKVHLSHIYEKFGVDGRLALLRYAEDKGLL